MPPVKKQKPNKSPKNVIKHENIKIKDEPVVSGQLQKKINKKQKTQKKDEKGIVFIKHLPHGFFEDQLKKYFEQFGEVTRVRLARSKRTGGSKGYAFVEFDYPEVAEVAAETMDNYLMFKKIVKAAYIPPEKQNFNYFRTSVRKIKNKSGKTIWVSSKTASIQRKMKQHNDWSEDNFQKRTKKQLNKIKKLGEKYAHLGIDINNIIVKPKTLTEKEKKELQESKAEKEEKATGNYKTLKRKTEKGAELQNQKKNKKQVSLEDLLGNTIQEDSEDEDYIAMVDSAEEEENQDDESSDEETYGFTKDSDDVEEDASENNDSIDDDEDNVATPIVKIKSKKSKTTFGKSLKTSNVERFDQMLKRKPQTGGIQKLNKKPLNQPSLTYKNKNKGSLQLTAAKELAKPLPKVPKSKLGKGGKFNKKKKNVK